MTTYAFAQLLKEAEDATEQFEYEQAISLYSQLLQETDGTTTDPVVQGSRHKAFAEQGRILQNLNLNEEAKVIYEAYQREAGPSRAAVDAQAAIANISIYVGDYAAALEMHQAVLKQAEEFSYAFGRAQALGGLGLVYQRWGRGEDAIRCLQQSLALFEQSGDRFQQARTLNRLGVAFHEQGALDKAINAYERSYRLVQNGGERGYSTAVFALNNLGEAYQELFAMEQARGYHQKALALAGENHFPFTSDIYRNLGVELLASGEIDDGIAHLYRALAAAGESNEPEIEMQVLYSLAMAEIQRGEYDVAEGHLGLLLDMAQAAKAQGALATAYYASGLLARQKGNERGAEQAWQQALFLAHETGQRFLIWNTHYELANIASNPDLANVHCRIAAGVIHQIAEPIEDVDLKNRFLNHDKVARILAGAG